MNDVSGIVYACAEKYGINQDDSRNAGFLERQLGKHNYDLTQKKFFNFMRDKLLLFHYLIGEKVIIAGYEGNTLDRKIGWYSPGDERSEGSINDWELKPVEERKSDLYLLRPAEMGFTASSKLWKDERKKRMHLRRTDDLLIRLYKNSTITAPKLKYLTLNG